MPEPLIHLSDVSKTVIAGSEPLTILSGISFEVKAGESLALVGASGSGKSTLLGLIAGLDLPSQGSVRVAGRALEQLDEEARAALRQTTIGFIFQSFMLLPALTALENVMLPAELKGDSGARAKASDLLEEVGLGHRLHHFPAQLSGGEQQRVAIARAFMLAPPLLLCDEPTGNLDAHTGQRISRLLFELNSLHNTTLLIVTHDSQLAEQCQRQLRIHAGALVLEGEHAATRT